MTILFLHPYIPFGREREGTPFTNRMLGIARHRIKVLGKKSTRIGYFVKGVHKRLFFPRIISD
jgi:hypothetical protein